jgi:hypothetical protein
MTDAVSFRVLGLPQAKGSTKAFMPKGWTRPILTSTCKGLIDALVHAGLVVEDGSRRSGAWRTTCVVYKAREHRTTEAA